MTVGHKIRELRLKKGLSAEELAELCNFSGRQIIYNYERGSKPSYQNLSTIANVLGVSPNHFFDDNSTTTESKTSMDKTLELLEAQLNKANNEKERLIQIIEKILKIQSPNFLDAPEILPLFPYMGEDSGAIAA